MKFQLLDTDFQQISMLTKELFDISYMNHINTNLHTIKYTECNIHNPQTHFGVAQNNKPSI